ncbi:MAG: metallophosphoesterase family protein [Deltaproteobacteria bacterium]|nr:metallophosphoesterase family protein [Deltaproteobacteria bacterium]
MRPATLLLCLALAPACVKGNPIELDGDLLTEGGTLRIDGCGYDLTTRYGAEAPRPGTAVFGPDPTPRHVHLGIMGDPKTSVVAQWRTKDDKTLASEIRYAKGASLPAADLVEEKAGIVFAYRSTGAEEIRVHQAHLCGLEPGTSYSYQVGGTDLDGAKSYSPVYTFRTAPDTVAHPDSEVVFGFVGDSRGGYDVWQLLIDELSDRQPDLILFSGDAVTIGLTQYEWEEFFDRAEPLFARVPLVSAHGNHEVNAVNYFSQIALPGDQENFGVDYGFAHITVGNDTPDDISKLAGEFKDKIAADMAKSNSARWKLFMHHQPMFSASTRHGPSQTLQDAWLPLVDQYKIDLVLNGHDHDYEISRPMINKQVQATNDNATVFVVAGGAGAELYDNGSDYWTLYSEKTYNAAVIRVRRDQMTMEAFRHDGTQIPQGFSKSKP